MEDRSVTNKEGYNLPFGFRKLPIEDKMRQENWQAVEGAILQRGDVLRERRRSPARAAIWVLPIVSIMAGIWYIAYRKGHIGTELLKTGYGEVKNILLPDSSTIILNANSSIRMVQHSGENSVGEVWLEGEAYFQVKKRPETRQKFVVHTSQIDVTVLGTKFNVNTRRKQAIVALEEGKVQLSMSDPAVTAPQTAKMVLRPGQVAVIDSFRKVNLGNDKNIGVHSGWSRNEFHFDHTSLQEIASLIEDTYGYRMEAKDNSVFQMQVSGDLRASNLKELVNVLEIALRLSMHVDNKTIYVARPLGG